MTLPQMSEEFAVAFRRELLQYAAGRGRLRKRWFLGLGSVVALLAAGGGFAYVGGFTNPEAMLPAEVTLPVSQEVYDAAYAKFADCMRDGGAPLVNERTVGEVHEFAYEASAEPVYETCYADFAGIDFQWQVAHSYDLPTYERVRECLIAIGIEPGGDDRTVWDQAHANGIDSATCATE